MEIVVAISSSASAIIVALISNLFTARHRKRDNIAGRMLGIEKTQQDISNKLDLSNRGTMTGLKIQLQETYDIQLKKVTSHNERWSPNIDQVFREAYKAYKDLGGNGIIDCIKGDMDIWRDKYAGEVFVCKDDKKSN